MQKNQKKIENSSRETLKKYVFNLPEAETRYTNHIPYIYSSQLNDQ